MATIHFVGGEKGGVGKSIVARVIAQYLIDRELPFQAFDTDRSHPSLLRFYADYAAPVAIDRYESLDTLVETAAEHPDLRLLVDLAAQTHAPLTQWLDESGVLDIAEECGIAIRYWQVMDCGKDSVDLLGKLLDQFGSRLRYVLVLNQLHGDRFTLFEHSGLKERALELNASLMSLRKLHEAVVQKIDASNASFWAAKHKSAQDANELGLLERQRVKVWLRNAYAQLDALAV